MSSTDPAETIGQALGMIPSGCCIMTCATEGTSTGMLASWIQQASFDPLMVTVAVKTGRPIAALIDEAGRFTLNLLGEDPFRLFKHFGGGFSLDEPAFEGISVEHTEYGVELEDAVAHLGCSVESAVQAGDHTVYLARVERGRRRAEGRPYVHIRKTGLSY